jgi:hypothetical protein
VQLKAGLVPAEEQLLPAEEQLLPAEADQGPAEEQLEAAEAGLVPAGEQLEAAEAGLSPAEAPLVSTSTRPVDTARKSAPFAVTEGSGPVLPSKQEADATALHAEAMRPVQGAEALTSPQSHACMPAVAGEDPREPRVPHQDHQRRGAMRLVRAVGKTSCPARTKEFSSAWSSESCRQWRDSTW